MGNMINLNTVKMFFLNKYNGNVFIQTNAVINIHPLCMYMI